MKEFKYCHEEITMGIEIPVTVCETQKEMVAELIMQKECFEFATERMNEVEEKRINGYYNFTDGTLNEYTYGYAMKEAISGTDEEMMYIIYKDGSKYWSGAGEVEGKFQRYGIKRAIISTPWGYTVFGDFTVNDMGDITIEESDIEEYGVYNGQYDVKEESETVVETVETEEKAEKDTIKATYEFTKKADIQACKELARTMIKRDIAVNGEACEANYYEYMISKFFNCTNIDFRIDFTNWIYKHTMLVRARAPNADLTAGRGEGGITMTAKEKRLKNWRENMNRIKITEAVATLMIIANSVTFIICNWMSLWSVAHGDWISTWLYLAVSVFNALSMQMMTWLAQTTAELMEESGEDNIINAVTNYILDF